MLGRRENLSYCLSAIHQLGYYRTNKLYELSYGEVTDSNSGNTSTSLASSATTLALYEYYCAVSMCFKCSETSEYWIDITRKNFHQVTMQLSAILAVIYYTSYLGDSLYLLDWVTAMGG